jgi:NAD(P)H dehydrogenase (quinone)
MTSTILILGATGNLGRLTASALASRYPGANLRLTSSRDSGCAALAEAFPGAEVMKADWYDVDSLAPAMWGVDKVFMATPDFHTDERVATPNVIDAIRRAGGKAHVVRFIAIPPGLTASDLAERHLATRCGANLHVIAKPLLDASGLPVTYINAACWIMFNLPWFLAPEVKRSSRLCMPAAADAPRRWVAEQDIAEVAALVLADQQGAHIGKAYLLTGAERCDFDGLAKLLSEILGRTVAYADDDRPLREAMGSQFDTLMTYFEHETQAYQHVPATDEVARLLGRPQTTLRDYLVSNKDLFA